MPLEFLKNAIQILTLFILCKIDIKIISSSSYINPFYRKHKKAVLSIDKSKNETLTNLRYFLYKCLNLANNNIYDYINKLKINVIPLYNFESII